MGPIVFRVTQLVKQDTRLAYSLMGGPIPWPNIAKHAAVARILACGTDHALDIAATRAYFRARSDGESIVAACEEVNHIFERALS